MSTPNSVTGKPASLSATGWEPRVIEDKVDVLSLPSGAVVMSEGGLVWQQIGEQWFAPGHADPFTAVAVTLPARVLFEGSR